MYIVNCKQFECVQGWAEAVVEENPKNANKKEQPKTKYPGPQLPALAWQYIDVQVLRDTLWFVLKYQTVVALHCLDIEKFISILGCFAFSGFQPSCTY